MAADRTSRDPADRPGIRPGTAADPRLERAWDARADSWTEVASTPAFLGFRDAVLSELTLDPDHHVLDLGCGSGLLTLPIARHCRLVTGLDASARMLDRLGERADQAGIEHLERVHGDMRRLPLETASVDAVVSCYAFHHLDDSQKLEALAEVARVLRPDGRLVVADMMFRIGLAPRDRAIVAEKVRLLLALGPAGAWRLVRNGARIATGRWEHPAPLDWWQQALTQPSFAQVRVRPLAHEAGLAVATRTTAAAAPAG